MPKLRLIYKSQTTISLPTSSTPVALFRKLFRETNPIRRNPLPHILVQQNIDRPLDKRNPPNGWFNNIPSQCRYTTPPANPPSPIARSYPPRETNPFLHNLMIFNVIRRICDRRVLKPAAVDLRIDRTCFAAIQMIPIAFRETNPIRRNPLPHILVQQNIDRSLDKRNPPNGWFNNIPPQCRYTTPPANPSSPIARSYPPRETNPISHNS